MPTLLRLQCSMCENESTWSNYPCCSKECLDACWEKYFDPDDDFCAECFAQTIPKDKWPFCSLHCKHTYRDIRRLDGYVWCTFCHEEPAPYVPSKGHTFCDTCATIEKEFCAVCNKVFATDTHTESSSCSPRCAEKLKTKPKESK